MQPNPIGWRRARVSPRLLVSALRAAVALPGVRDGIAAALIGGTGRAALSNICLRARPVRPWLRHGGSIAVAYGIGLRPGVSPRRSHTPAAATARGPAGAAA